MTIQTTREERRQLEKENARQPAVLTEWAEQEWIDRWGFSSPPPLHIWRSREFLVQMHVSTDGVRLSVNRCTLDAKTGRWTEGITWEELQRVKRECGFGDHWAVEIFPPDDRIVNVANMRHLWLLPAAPSFGGWNRGPI